MDWEKKFPSFFQKSACIKLNRIKITSSKFINNNKKSTKCFSLCDSPNLRVTRSKTRGPVFGEWVRILKGHYKDDIAKFGRYDVESRNIFVKLCPRIDYSTSKKKNSTRTPATLFDFRYASYLYVINTIQIWTANFYFVLEMVTKWNSMVLF